MCLLKQVYRSKSQEGWGNTVSPQTLNQLGAAYCCQSLQQLVGRSSRNSRIYWGAGRLRNMSRNKIIICFIFHFIDVIPKGFPAPHFPHLENSHSQLFFQFFNAIFVGKPFQPPSKLATCSSAPVKHPAHKCSVAQSSRCGNRPQNPSQQPHQCQRLGLTHLLYAQNLMGTSAQ